MKRFAYFFGIFVFAYILVHTITSLVKPTQAVSSLDIHAARPADRVQNADFINMTRSSTADRIDTVVIPTLKTLPTLPEIGGTHPTPTSPPIVSPSPTDIPNQYNTTKDFYFVKGSVQIDSYTPPVLDTSGYKKFVFVYQCNSGHKGVDIQTSIDGKIWFYVGRISGDGCTLGRSITFNVIGKYYRIHLDDGGDSVVSLYAYAHLYNPMSNSNNSAVTFFSSDVSESLEYSPIFDIQGYTKFDLLLHCYKPGTGIDLQVSTDQVSWVTLIDKGPDSCSSGKVFSDFDVAGRYYRARLFNNNSPQFGSVDVIGVFYNP
jgi:hypothetical protein